MLQTVQKIYKTLHYWIWYKSKPFGISGILRIRLAEWQEKEVMKILDMGMKQ